MPAELPLEPAPVDGATSLADALQIFGAGHAAPGSGSANALIGAIGAALVASVATKTLEHADEISYRPVSDAAMKIAKRGRVLSEHLLDLVDKDAKAFAPVIALRREAKSPTEQYNQDQALRREIAATKRATEIPLQIAAMGTEIAQMAMTMVERGFKPAMGESRTALFAALAATNGAICVARLNISNVAKKIGKLNDPGYERPWLRRMTKRANELEEIAVSWRDRERALQDRPNAAPTKRRRKRAPTT